MRRKIVAVGCFVLVLAGTTTAWITAQSVAVTPVTPRILSGADVGFRVEGLRGSTPVGKIVVRVNGQWIEAETAAPLTRPAQTSR